MPEEIRQSLSNFLLFLPDRRNNCIHNLVFQFSCLSNNFPPNISQDFGLSLSVYHLTLKLQSDSLFRKILLPLSNVEILRISLRNLFHIPMRHQRSKNNKFYNHDLPKIFYISPSILDSLYPFKVNYL